MTPPATAGSNEIWELFLFVAGKEHPRSIAVYTNLKRICDQHLAGKFQLQVIDITTSPEIALREDVLAIPTLLRNQPVPRRRIIGDLSDTKRVLAILGIEESNPSPIHTSMG